MGVAAVAISTMNSTVSEGSTVSPEEAELRKILGGDRGKYKTETVISTHKKDRVYVPTRAVDTVIKTLEKNNFAIIIGQQGSGKSKIAIDVASRLKIPSLLLPNPLTDFYRLINCSKTQLIIIEDIFGKQKPKFFEDVHSKIIELIYICTGKETTKVIVTSRPFSDGSTKSIINTYFRKSHDEILIDLNKKDKLSEEEKTVMLKTYMKFYNITSFKKTKSVFGSFEQYDPSLYCKPSEDSFKLLDNFVYDTISKSDPSFGFPLACLHFCLNKDFVELGAQFFRNPSSAVLTEITLMRKKGKEDDNFGYQYSILVYILLKRQINMNKIDTNLLTRIFGVVYPKKQTSWMEQDIKDAIEVLSKYYILRRHDNYVFQHQMAQEAVGFSFGFLSSDSQKLFISECAWPTMMNFVRPFSYNAGKNELVINLKPDTYLKLLDRFRRSLFRMRVEKITRRIYSNIPKSTHHELVNLILKNRKTDIENYSSLLLKDWMFYSADNLQKVVEDSVRTEMTSSQFSSIDEYGNSFVHYWMLEEFENKTSLFETIISEFPELMEISNYYKQTPVHFALYTGWYSIIKGHYSRWMDVVSGTFDWQNNFETFVRTIRWMSVSNIYSLIKLKLYTVCNADNNYRKSLFHLKRALLVRQTNLECLLHLNNGTKITKYALSMEDIELNHLPLKINAKTVLFDKLRSQHVNSMHVTEFCTRQRQTILDDLYLLMSSDESCSKKFKSYLDLQNNLNDLVYNNRYILNGIKFTCGDVFPDSESWKDNLRMYFKMYCLYN